MGSYVKAILLLIVLVILVTFGINNLEPIRLHYYFGLSSMPLPIYGVVYGALLVGIFVGMLVGINSRFSQRKKIKLLQRENRELKAKVGKVERRLVINRLCRKCGKCVETCGQGALSIGDEKAEVDLEKCIFCGYCAPECPVFAIRVV